VKAKKGKVRAGRCEHWLPCAEPAATVIDAPRPGTGNRLKRQKS